MRRCRLQVMTVFFPEGSGECDELWFASAVESFSVRGQRLGDTSKYKKKTSEKQMNAMKSNLKSVKPYKKVQAANFRFATYWKLHTKDPRENTSNISNIVI